MGEQDSYRGNFHTMDSNNKGFRSDIIKTKTKVRGVTTESYGLAMAEASQYLSMCVCLFNWEHKCQEEVECVSIKQNVQI